jgi:hypothetical protein
MPGLAVHEKFLQALHAARDSIVDSASDFAFNLSVGLLHTIGGGKNKPKINLCFGLYL